MSATKHSTRIGQLRQRLDAITQGDETPYERRVRLGHQVVAGTASVHEVGEWISPDTERWRRRLMETVTRLRVIIPLNPDDPAPITWPWPIWSGRGPWEDALSIISYPPGSPFPEDRYRALAAAAYGPRQLRAFPALVDDPYYDDQRPHHYFDNGNWLETGRAGTWAEAAAYLHILGPDRGAFLHRKVVDDLQDSERRDVELMEGIRRRLMDGTAVWEDFLVWYQSFHAERLQATLYLDAIDRRHARTIGPPLPCHTIRDYAAERISYPPGEEPPEDLELILCACRVLDGGHRMLEEEAWYQANVWWWFHGGGHSEKVRRHADDLWRLTVCTPTSGRLFDPDGLSRTNEDSKFALGPLAPEAWIDHVRRALGQR